MNSRLFLKDLQRSLTALFAWTSVICFLLALTMSFFTSFSQNQSPILKVVHLIPAAAMKFRGLSNPMDMFSIMGFYASNNTIFMMVMGSIFSIILASNILLKEEYGRTAEFLMSRPLTRGEVFASKTSVYLINVLFLNAMAMLTGFICLELFKNSPYDRASYFVLCFYTFLLNLSFGALGFLISSLSKKGKPVTVGCIGLVLFLYFIYTISKITDKASILGWFSPFRYVDVNVLSPGYGLNLPHITAFIGATAALFAAAFYVYKKKDLLT